MNLAYCAGLDKYAAWIYPDGAVTWARLSEVDKFILCAVSFVVEGATVNFTYDQVIEKINGVLRSRFPSFHKSVEEAILVTMLGWVGSVTSTTANESE